MIIKASERGGGAKLAAHLMNMKDNDHIELHEIRGLAADDLRGAFDEITAQSKMTNATQPFFSVSINPPEGETATIADFEEAVNRIEKKMRLEDQPRAVVFHEKEGRRHAHVVWSRIDMDNTRAINLPCFKAKLNDIARDLYKKHGWELPEGFKKKGQRDKNNFSLSEWQQTKRAGLDAKDFKALLKSLLERSDNRQSFEAALSERGLYLGRGDKRGFVVIDSAGELYSLSRYSEQKKKDLIEKLGKFEALPTVDQIQLLIEHRNAARLDAKLEAQKKLHKAERQQIKEELEAMRRRQRTERRKLRYAQLVRFNTEELTRANRIRAGVRGFFQRMTGRAGKIERENAAEREEAKRRDEAERQQIIDKHLLERRALQQRAQQLKQRQDKTRQRLKEAARAPQQTPDSNRLKEAKEAQAKSKEAREQARKSTRGKGRRLDR